MAGKHYPRCRADSGLQRGQQCLGGRSEAEYAGQETRTEPEHQDWDSSSLWGRWTQTRPARRDEQRPQQETAKKTRTHGSLEEKDERDG